MIDRFSKLGVPVGWRAAVTLLLIALIAHAGSLSCGWIWDDDSYVTANLIMSSPRGWYDVFIPRLTPQYYPLVFLGFWVQHAMVGVEPFFYHLVNVLMHAVNGLLLFFVLRRVGVPSAFWIAAIFACHPMGVESVAWVTERKNVQSMMFALGSVYCFIRSLDASPERRLGTWIVSFVFFLAAMLSKTTAVFVPPCLVLIALWQRRVIHARLLLAVLPYFVVGATLGLVTAHLEKTHVGASGPDFVLTIAERFQLAGRSAIFYAASFVQPWRQIFIYPRFQIDTTSVLAWLPMIAGIALLFEGTRRWRQGRGLLVCFLWYAAALFPALGFVDVWPFQYSFVADHFAYAAIPVLALAFVRLIDVLGMQIYAVSRMTNVLLTVTVIAFVACSMRATSKYESEETLWTATIADNPEAWIAQNNLATIRLREAGVLASKGEIEDARAKASEALVLAKIAGTLKPGEFTNAVNRSEAHRLLGEIKQALTEIDNAIAMKPELGDLRWMRARLLESSGRVEEARAGFLHAAELVAGTSAEIAARRDLMRLAIARADTNDAIVQCRRLVELDRFNADMIANLGALLAAGGDREQGRRELWRSLLLRQNFSSEQVFVSAALRYLKLAIDSTLDDAEAREATALANELYARSNRDISVRYLQLALQLSRGDESTRNEIESIEQGARSAGATVFADEITAFLARRPRNEG